MGNSKIENYKKAVKKLAQVVSEAGEHPSELIRDGVIQRFEFCTELAWKSIREYMLNQHFAELNSPKTVMKEAFSNGIISCDKEWLSILNDRNLTAHIYDEATAEEIFGRIQSQYLKAFEELNSFFNNL